MPRSPAQIICDKRDRNEHSREDILSLIAQFMDGRMSDYQMTAWLMAVYLNGLTDKEMLALTEAMLLSGDTLTHPKARGPRIDKHSTGGVGDKISLPLAPLVAEAGLAVPMISGRGLGHTGGTLDKLESIPGYNVRLSAAQFRKVVEKVGCSIIGQTESLAPADRRIYSLRDVTGTVACRPLIVASILSKKLAAGLDGLVLDVKVGRGAFMKTPNDAQALAKSLVKISKGLGTPATACLTRMDAPLGATIGNALEVRESIEILQGSGQSDVTRLTLLLGAEMLVLGGLEKTRKSAEKVLAKALASGKALERFGRMIEAQGGDRRVVDDLTLLPRAPKQVRVLADASGFLTDVDSLTLAELALEMGAGRRRAEDAVDPAVGIELHVKPGDWIDKGQPLLTLHQRTAAKSLTPGYRAAFVLGDKPPKLGPLLLGRVR